MTEATLVRDMSQVPGRNLLEVATDLVPLLRENAKAVEEGRRLTPAVHEAFLQAGFYRMTTPQENAISPRSLPELMRVLETLAFGDASSAWTAWAGLGMPAMSAFMDDAGVTELYDSPEHVVIGSTAGMGRATAVEGGYWVTGHWSFLSGIRQASHAGGLCSAFDGETQRLGPQGGPAVVLPIWSVADCTVIENWESTGLRGTGSHDMDAHEIFVPYHRVIDFTKPPRPDLGPVYYIEIDNAANVTVASIAVGTASAAIEAFRELAFRKRLEDGTLLAESPQAKLALGLAETQLAQVRGHLWETVEVMWETLLDGTHDAEAWFPRTAMASVTAVQAATDVALSLYRAAGTSAVRAGILDRIVRDLLTLSAHRTVQPGNLLKHGGASFQYAN